METCPLDLPEPDFGSETRRLPEQTTPRSLYGALLYKDERVDCFEPAFRFARAALDRAASTVKAIGEAADPRRFLDRLLLWAQTEPLPQVPDRFVSTWPARLARELAPFALTDGVWLEGAAHANVIESRVGMLLLRQLMIRFGDPSTRESYAERYAQLLRSIGIVPENIARWEHEESVSCCDISYEYALLGHCLSLFPSVLLPETVGFNLWAAVSGPSPLLRSLQARLLPNACTRYFDRYEFDVLRDLAIQAAVELLTWPASKNSTVPERLASGFIAARRAQRRWEQAMCGGAIPISPQAAVLDMIKRKARFAAGHHSAVYLEGESLEVLLNGQQECHQRILQHLARSPLVSPGRPDESPLLTHSVSVTGPMFEAFTQAELRELREWIEGLVHDTPPAAPPPRFALEGVYVPPLDIASTDGKESEQLSLMQPYEVLFRFVNADRYPLVRIYAKRYAESVLAQIDAVFDTDPLFAEDKPPKYSEAAVAQLVWQHHERNLRWRKQSHADLETLWQQMFRTEPMMLPLDGCWLQGFVDVYRSGLEEYGWLFRIYASEQGDGQIDWNHNRIYRLCFPEDDPKCHAPTTSLELFAAYRDHFLSGVLLKTAMSLHTSYFLPELLGLNLANEASGVGGTYLYYAHRYAEADNPYRSLDFKLHNSIDNYVSGHTKWSLSAVQAFMNRVRAVAPSLVESQWRRIWRFLRLGQVFDHGSPAEKRAFAGIWFPPASSAS